MTMSPSQRSTRKKEISKRLSTEDWPLIFVTLKEYSPPTLDSFGAARSEYILNMIQDAPDQTLIDLARHVGHAFEAPRSDDDLPFWRPGMLRVFLSHLAAHRSFAARLKDELLSFGISAFVAHNDIEPTADWQTQIEIALVTCHSLVALLHPEFHRSNWTDQEIGFAVGRGVPVFSVRFGEDPYGFIGRFQAFPGNNERAGDLAQALFVGYRKHKQTQRRMAEALVARFIESDSFANARERVGYLEEFEVWDVSFSKKLEAAVQSNLQIVNSYGVLDRVYALVKKWENSAP